VDQDKGELQSSVIPFEGLPRDMFRKVKDDSILGLYARLRHYAWVKNNGQIIPLRHKRVADLAGVFEYAVRRHAGLNSTSKDTIKRRLLKLASHGLIELQCAPREKPCIRIIPWSQIPWLNRYAAPRLSQIETDVSPRDLKVKMKIDASLRARASQTMSQIGSLQVIDTINKMAKIALPTEPVSEPPLISKHPMETLSDSVSHSPPTGGLVSSAAIASGELAALVKKAALVAPIPQTGIGSGELVREKTDFSNRIVKSNDPYFDNSDFSMGPWVYIMPRWHQAALWRKFENGNSLSGIDFNQACRTVHELVWKWGKSEVLARGLLDQFAFILRLIINKSSPQEVVLNQVEVNFNYPRGSSHSPDGVL
jgi:hypothetical protein